MKNNKFLKAFTMIISSTFLPLLSEAPVCHHCEEIRLYNKEHHKNYEYFEDYQSEGKVDKVAETTKGKINSSNKIAEIEKPSKK